MRVVTEPSSYVPDATLDLGNGDQVVLANALNASNGRVTVIQFADGSEWRASDLLAASARATVQTEPGRVAGTTGNDVIDATAASEFLEGGTGDDSYVYSRGDGIDRIADEPSSRFSNTLRIQGYDSSTAQFAQSDADPTDLVITFAGSDDRLVINDAFFNAAYSSGSSGGVSYLTRWRTIKEITFDDAVMTLEAIHAGVMAAQQTDGNDQITLTEIFETVESGLGNDSISGDMRGDTIVFERGDGQDVIYPSSGTRGYFLNREDTILDIRGYLPEDVTVTRDVYAQRGYILTFAGTDDRIELRGDGRSGAGGITDVRFIGEQYWSFAQLEARAISPFGDAGGATSGNDTLVGTDQAESFEGGRGDDVIEPGYYYNATDTIVFARGDGQDLVSEGDTYSLRLRLELTGINPEDIRLVNAPQNADYVIVEVLGSDDRILIEGGISRLTAIEFGNGDLWSASNIYNAVEDYPDPFGTVENVNISRYGGVIEMGPGDQRYTLPMFEPIGAADDAISAAGDTPIEFRYAQGGGHDLISADTSPYASPVDVRVVLTDVALADVTPWLVTLQADFAPLSTALVLDWGTATDSVTITSARDSGNGTEVRIFEFAGGETRSLDELLALADGAEQTEQRSFSGSFDFARGLQSGRYVVDYEADILGPEIPGDLGGLCLADLTDPWSRLIRHRHSIHWAIPGRRLS